MRIIPWRHSQSRLLYEQHREPNRSIQHLSVMPFSPIVPRPRLAEHEVIEPENLAVRASRGRSAESSLHYIRHRCVRVEGRSRRCIGRWRWCRAWRRRLPRTWLRTSQTSTLFVYFVCVIFNLTAGKAIVKSPLLFYFLLSASPLNLGPKYVMYCNVYIQLAIECTFNSHQFFSLLLQCF